MSGMQSTGVGSIEEPPLQAVLARLEAVKPSGSGFQARCPAHDDRTPSLSVTAGEDGRVLLHCHAGCNVPDICAAIGLDVRDLFVAPSRRVRPRLVTTYDYQNADGTLLFQVVRYLPKDFRQRRPNGAGGWIWNLKGVPRILYRLPALLAAPSDAIVFISEGEKDADNVAALDLVATTCPLGAGKWNKLANDSALVACPIVILCDKDEPGREHALDVATRLHGRAREVCILELPASGKDVSDWLDQGGTREELLRLAGEAPLFQPQPRAQDDQARPADDDRPAILIHTDEHVVVNQTVAALVADAGLYCRGGLLVRVLRHLEGTTGLKRDRRSLVIAPVPLANLRERLTARAAFIKETKRGPAPAHPPQWLVTAVDARSSWPGLRELQGVSAMPVLRPDGTLWQTPGYDAMTGMLYAPPEEPIVINEDADGDDADTALHQLFEVVCDFQFEKPEHKAAWVAGVLTPLARCAFEGPTPLFLIDANVAGAGKGLLAQTIGHISLGHDMPVSGYSHDSEEMRKKITSVAIAGDRVVLLDNLAGRFGNDALDRALTGTRWHDRLLSRNQVVDLPLLAVWYATGNNVLVGADTARRIVHIRLDIPHEHPEERSDFRHPDLLGWVCQQRTSLLRAALTILVAYCRAGRPQHQVVPFGSYEGWSSLVRQAVIWVGLPDPCATRAALQAMADTTVGALDQVMEAWRGYLPSGRSIALGPLLKELYLPGAGSTSPDPGAEQLRSALELFAGVPAGKVPSAQILGARLNSVRKRVRNGWCFCPDPDAPKRFGTAWRLVAADEIVGGA